MRLIAFGVLVAFLGCLPSASTAAPITLSQIDTFQDLTTDGWFAGGGPLGAFPPVPPHVVATGGPTGANDAYLSLTSGGGQGPGSRLVAMNVSQWAGDYSGIATIEMDLLNLGAVDLTIRLLFEDPIPGPPVNIAVTTMGALLPAGSGWTHVAFPLSAADLTALLGSADPLISNTTLLRIIHSVDAGEADAIAAVLGVDNISAGPVRRPGPFQTEPVPEPATLLLVGSGIAAAAVHRRRRAAR